MEIEPRRVLITGGARRLGKHIALAMSAKHAVIGINFHNTPTELVERTEQECFALGATEVYLLEGDITKEATEIVRNFSDVAGGLDILINNAGVLPPQRKLEELSLEAFRATLELNLLAPFATARAASGLMQPGTAIVNIASLGGMQIWKERIDYNVSKSALITLTKALARELAPKGISVNAVAPGAILVGDDEGTTSVPLSRIPMERYGSPEDIAKAVLYLAFDAPYVTGETIVVDGGRALT